MQKTKLNIRPYQDNDRDQVINLWQQCNLIAPQNNPHDDIISKLKVQPELFLVGCVNGEIVATIMAGYEGHRGWLNYLAVSPDKQRSGLGRAILKAAEQRLTAIGCPKVNLQVRQTNTEAIEFYQRIGYKIDNVVSLGKRLDK